jgi:hypothetical protein
MNRGREKVSWFLAILLGWSLVMAASPEPADQDEELDEVVTTLTDLGLDPTAAEQEDWQTEVSDQASSESAHPWSGFLRLGGQQRPDGSWRGRGHLSQAWGAWSGAIRGDWPGQPDPLAGGFLQWEKPAVTLIAGRIGLTAGCGLLLSGPGRSGSLVADGTLISVRTRLVGKTSRPDRRTLEGGGGRIQWHRWEAQWMTGRMPDNDALAGDLVAAGSLKYGHRKRWLGFQGLKVPGGLGWGCSGLAAGETWQAQAEFARRRDHASSARQLDWAASVTLRPGGDWLLEGAMTASEGKDFWGLGQRPGLLKGDEGRAWALRVAARLGPATKLAALWGQSSTRHLGSEAQLELNSTGDLILTHRPDRTWTLSSRVLVTGKDRRLWQGRFPWLPADSYPIKHKSLVQGTVGYIAPGRDLKLTAKLLRQVDASGTRWRRLWSVRGHFAVGETRRIRAGYGQAWGDEVDLVTALVPVPGRILPRHWGQWQSETHLALGWQWAGGEFWLAGSWRRPEGVEPVGGAWEAWMEGRIRW